MRWSFPNNLEYGFLVIVNHFEGSIVEITVPIGLIEYEFTISYFYRSYTVPNCDAVVNFVVTLFCEYCDWKPGKRDVPFLQAFNGCGGGKPVLPEREKVSAYPLMESSSRFWVQYLCWFFWFRMSRFCS